MAVGIPFGWVVVDESGNVVSGAKIYFKKGGTSTDQAAYTDDAITTPAANPTIASSNGWFRVYLDPSLDYDITVKSSDDATTFYTATHYGLSDTSQPVDPTLTAIAGANAVNRKIWRGTGADTVELVNISEATNILNVLDYGATGDGVTDDTTALQACLDAAMAAGTNGGATIIAPEGDYIFTSTLTLQTASDVTTGIKIIGAGGYTGEGTTRFIFTPASSDVGILMSSTQQCTWDGVEFISANNNVSELIRVTAENDPVFSAFMNTFRNCSFRPFSGFSPTTRLITIAGGVLTKFEGCWFSGTDQEMQLGENLPALASGGGAGQTIFERCEIYIDIVIQNAENTTFINNVFGRVNTTTHATIAPVSIGFTRNNYVTFIGNAQALDITSADETFFTQGTGSFGVVAFNNRLSYYKIGFNINGDGGFQSAGNYYSGSTFTTGVIAIQLGSSATQCLIGPEDWSAIDSGGFTRVSDSRTDKSWRHYGTFGIGGTAAELVDIHGDANAQGSAIPTIRITNTDTAVTASDETGRFEFFSKDSSDADRVTGYITSVAEDAGINFAMGFAVKPTVSTDAAVRMTLSSDGELTVDTQYEVAGTKVVGARGAAVADASGGATVDAEARTAINTLLARLRAHGLIAT